MKVFLHDGNAISVEIYGDGPAILLPVNPAPIEGKQAEEMRRWGTDPALGRNLIGGLSDSYRVIAFDYEGHVQQHPKPDTLTPDLIAADFLAIADAAGAERFAYYGYSWLALSGLQLAIRTDRLSALIMGGYPPVGGPYKEMLAVTQAANEMAKSMASGKTGSGETANVHATKSGTASSEMANSVTANSETTNSEMTNSETATDEMANNGIANLEVATDEATNKESHSGWYGPASPTPANLREGEMPDNKTNLSEREMPDNKANLSEGEMLGNKTSLSARETQNSAQSLSELESYGSGANLSKRERRDSRSEAVLQSVSPSPSTDSEQPQAYNWDDYDWSNVELPMNISQTEQFVTLYEQLQAFDDRAVQDRIRCPRLCFAGSADRIEYGAGWGEVTVDIAGPLIRHREELEALGWNVRVLDGLDHTSAMQAANVLPLLRPWLDALSLGA